MKMSLYMSDERTNLCINFQLNSIYFCYLEFIYTTAVCHISTVKTTTWIALCGDH